MKKLLSLVLVLAIGSSALASLTPVVTEDFEDGAVDATLGSTGWTNPWGGAPVTDFLHAGPGTTVTGHIALDGSKGAFKLSGGAPDATRNFQQTNTIASTEVDVYMKYDQKTHNGWNVLAGMSTPASDALKGPQFGGAGQMYLRQAGAGASFYGDSVGFWSNWEYALQMTINQTDVTLSTGTVYYRSYGSTTWIEDSVIKNVNLGLTASNQPSTWTGWWLNGSINNVMDNFEMGTGIVPEPATMALLALGGLFLRKRASKK